MSQFFNNCLRIIRGLLIALAGIVTLSQGGNLYDAIKRQFFELSASLFRADVYQIVRNTLDKSHFFAFVALFAIWVILFGYRAYLVEKRSRLSYMGLLSLLNPLRAWKTIDMMHNYHHLFHEKKNQMEGFVDLRIGSDNVKSSIEALINNARQVLSCALGVDVSVHVKLFERDDLEGGCVSLEDSLLKAYVRSSSRRETKARQSGKLRARRNEELFKIVSSDSCADDDLSYKVNSGYNYVFSMEHYWICNNLRKQEECGCFENTSTDWQDYYNSLAVFLISAPMEIGVPVTECPFGLFIVDSHEVGRFDRKRLKYVGGYLAHRLHDFLTYRSNLEDGTIQ